MFYLCSKSVTTGPKSTGNGGVTPGRHHLACFLFMSIMQHFLTASLFSRAFNTCFRLVAINIRWSISYSQVSQQPTCLTRLNRLIYCKRALMSVVRRDRWSPSILRQYNRPWMLVNSCTEQQIWSGHIQTPTTSRTLQCNQETLELALGSHWKLFITPLHVFFFNSSLLWPGDNYSQSLWLKYRVVMFDRMFSLSPASVVLLTGKICILQRFWFCGLRK